MGSELSRAFFDLVQLVCGSVFAGDFLVCLEYCYWTPRACISYLRNHYPALLIFAAKRDSVFITRALIEAGVDVRWESDFWVNRRPGSIDWNRGSREHPISYAAKLGHTATLALLLQHGADIEYKGHEGCRPLLLAAQNNHVPATRLLISQGADLLSENMWSQSPISVALHSGSSGTLETLLEALQGRSSEYVKQGLQQLLFAASSSRGDIQWIHFALSRGADINYRKSQYNHTALLRAAANKASPATVRVLLENGADPNVRTLPLPGLRWHKQTETPLLVAARNPIGSTSIIELLLIHGANTDGEDAYLALRMAVQRGETSLFHLLVEHGAPLELALPRTQTLMRTALIADEKEMVKLLLEMGMSPSDEDLAIIRERD
ncbi:ankyrin repeat-containing domain protein [Aspergillus californicus]